MPTVSRQPLSRKITVEEASEGYIRVNKSWLPKLPAPNEPFQLKVGNSQLKVRIQRRDEPKEHYVLALPLITLEPGAQATLRPVSGDRVVLELST